MGIKDVTQAAGSAVAARDDYAASYGAFSYFAPEPTGGRFMAFDMPVLDIREQARAPALDVDGFAVIDTPSVVKHFDNEEAVRRAYYAQTEAIVMQATGAARVVALSHAVRLGAARADDSLANVRVDVSAETAQAYAEKAGGEPGGRRFAVINLWRPIGGPVEARPLAVAGATSLSSEDLVPESVVVGGSGAEGCLVRHSPAHDWRYLSRQRADEALLIKCFDSIDDGRARQTARAAFDDAMSDPAAPLSDSIEVRTLVLYE